MVQRCQGFASSPRKAARTCSCTSVRSRAAASSRSRKARRSRSKSCRAREGLQAGRSPGHVIGSASGPDLATRKKPGFGRVFLWVNRSGRRVLCIRASRHARYPDCVPAGKRHVSRRNSQLPPASFHAWCCCCLSAARGGHRATARRPSPSSRRSGIEGAGRVTCAAAGRVERDPRYMIGISYPAGRQQVSRAGHGPETLCRYRPRRTDSGRGGHGAGKPLCPTIFRLSSARSRRRRAVVIAADGSSYTVARMEPTGRTFRLAPQQDRRLTSDRAGP